MATPEEYGEYTPLASVPFERTTSTATVEHGPQQSESIASMPDGSTGLSRRSSNASSLTARSSNIRVRRLRRIIARLADPVKGLSSLADRKLRRSSFYGWRMGVLVGSFMSAIVLLCNVIIVVVGGLVNGGYDGGISNIFSSGAATISRLSTVSHLFVNIFSTILLGASNYTMQVLSSPTRADIDRIHSKGQWLDIGMLSVRNLWLIPRRRAALWLFLAVSSVPLHLFYNAAVFQITTFNEYNIISIQRWSEEWTALNSDNTTYRKLAGSTWYDIYNNRYVSEHGDLYLVIDRLAFFNPRNSNISWSSYYWPLEIKHGNETMIKSLACNSSTWIDYHNFAELTENSGGIHPDDWAWQNSWTWPMNARVVYSFSKIVAPQSRIQLSLWFMLVVIVSNALKLVIMLWVLITDKSDYIVTLGDAAASFLERPDPTTSKRCILGKDDMIWSLGIRPYYDYGAGDLNELTLRLSGAWKPRPLLYSASLSRDRQIFLSILFCLLVSANVVFPLFESSQIQSWGTASDDILPFAGGILFNAWIVNSPQIVLSFCYLGLNSICTSIASAEEWNNLARYRKGLRVTRPKEEQRSTYFLQLPYRRAIPLIITSGTLHWLLSQSFFLVRLDMLDRQGKVVSESSKSACGFSSLSFLVFCNLALVLVFAIGWSGMRHLQPKLPAAASCSLVISAACHSIGEKPGAQLKKVKWGVVKGELLEGVEHCCISSDVVKKPQVGKVYR